MRRVVTICAVVVAGLTGAAWSPSMSVAAPPDDTVPDSTVPDSTVPDSTVPDNTVPDDTVPDDSRSESPQGEVTGADADDPPVTLPLTPVPTGCEAPRLPHLVFVGSVVDRDYRTVRYEIDRIRSGRPEPFALGDRIDVRYGLDAQYLDDDATYLVAAVVDEDLGLLVSRVTEPIENFGGDEVIGVSETDVDCPDYEDPMRTLHLDGTPIEASVLRPFLDAKVSIVSALLVPFGVAVAAIFVLAMFRLSLAGLFRAVAGANRRRFS